MVIFADLDEDSLSDPHLDPRLPSSAFTNNKHQLYTPILRDRSGSIDEIAVTADERPNPNLNGFSAILCCYPIVASLAGHLDLNSLHNLSRTCRQVRANLLQYRKQLIAQSLRCSRENNERGTTLADGLRGAHLAWSTNGGPSSFGRITSGKVGKCARDMVADCQHCGTIVCRNCTARPFPRLKGRHRRLCRTCKNAPLSLLTPLNTVPEMDVGASSSSSPSSSTSSSPTRLHRFPTPPIYAIEEGDTALIPVPEPCDCPDTVWLCQPCGHALRAADLAYERGWRWRTQYCTQLGGLGTGIGEGNEGVQCGRRHACLAAKIVEQEVDCDAQVLRVMEEEAAKIASDGTGRSWEGTSFAVQEIEGIGGVVKKKIKKLVRLGAYVTEYEDERSEVEKRDFLQREIEGKVRSFCSWCDRVIPSMVEAETNS